MVKAVRPDGRTIQSNETPVSLLNQGVFYNRPFHSVVLGESKTTVLSFKVSAVALDRLHLAAESLGRHRAELARDAIDDALTRLGF